MVFAEDISTPKEKKNMYPLQNGKNQTTTMTSASVRNILFR